MATTIVVTAPVAATSTTQPSFNYTATVDAPVARTLYGSLNAIANEIAKILKEDLD